MTMMVEGLAASPRATARFGYRAASRAGTIERGEVLAQSRDAAAELLIDRGLMPLEIRQLRGTTRPRAGLRAADAAQGLRILATLLESGLSITRALEALRELAPEGWRAGIPLMRESLRSGKSLGVALETAGIQLPSVVLGIVRAGEAGGATGPAVRQAAELMETHAATRSALRAALAYPAMLLVAGALSLTLLVGVVLPRFATILGELGQTLPPSTRLVLSTASVLRAACMPGVLMLLIGFVVWRGWTATTDGARRWHGMLLRFPIVGTIRESSSASRVASALAVLLESGTPLATALVHAGRTAGDNAIEHRLGVARELILRGESIGRSLERVRALTPSVIRFVRAGEETGQLSAMLARGAKLEAERAERLVKGAVRILEPGLILGFGGVIALVAAALLQAMYGLRAAS